MKCCFFNDLGVLIGRERAQRSQNRSGDIMGLYDRDYMRRDDRGPAPDEPLEDRLAGRIVAFFRRHPRLPFVVLVIFIALVILAVALFAGQPN